LGSSSSSTLALASEVLPPNLHELRPLEIFLLFLVSSGLCFLPPIPRELRPLGFFHLFPMSSNLWAPPFLPRHLRPQ
jgi:hypothetical protein